MNSPTSQGSTPVVRRRGRHRYLLVVGAVLALFLLFEVGIRHIPPDGMTVSFNDAAGGDSAGTLRYTAPADQQIVADYYAAFNRAAVRSEWTIHSCAMTDDPSSVAFTWHGLPVESWMLVGCDYVESAGGISDELAVQHLLPDISMPPPSPHTG